MDFIRGCLPFYGFHQGLEKGKRESHSIEKPGYRFIKGRRESHSIEKPGWGSLKR